MKREGHEERIGRAILSLEGLAVGDAFGQRFFYEASVTQRPRLPPGPWLFTDDTVMAISIVEILDRHGGMDQDQLAERLAHRFQAEPRRGYGTMAAEILRSINVGMHWREATQKAFAGEGSKGNGAAMRAAPIGAYFADDVSRAAGEAEKSASVTHAHPEGIAGAVAVGVAAAVVQQTPWSPDAFFAAVLEYTPASATRDGILHARALSAEMGSSEAASILGSGERVLSEDTVPFCLWCVAHATTSFDETLWRTVAGGGDRDTTCAIVGSIVSLRGGPFEPPKEWINAREPLPMKVSLNRHLLRDLP